MTLEELKKVVAKHMLLEDDHIIKLLAATVIANRLPTAAVWLFIVTSSSGGKSMLLDALSSCYGIFRQDDVTANTFISGAKGKDGQQMGLLANMKDKNPIMIISDFTTYLQKESTQNDAIMAQFRMIYDGQYNKSFGTGEKSIWEGKMGLIAGVTPVVYVLNAKYAAMGERFIMYHFDQPDREAATMMAMQETDYKATQNELRVAFKSYIDSIPMPAEGAPLPALDVSTSLAISKLADIASRARSGVSRNENARGRPIITKPTPEMPMRMAKQLSFLARSFSVLNGGGIETGDQQAIYKVALDGIAPQRKDVMIELTKRARMNTEAIGSELKLSRDSVEEPLEDLTALEVVDRHRPVSSGGGWEWSLKPQYRDILEKFEHIKQTNEVLRMDEGDISAPLPIEPPPNYREISMDDLIAEGDQKTLI